VAVAIEHVAIALAEPRGGAAAHCKRERVSAATAVTGILTVLSAFAAIVFGMMLIVLLAEAWRGNRHVRIGPIHHPCIPCRRTKYRA
jgi:hypothetical protein